MTKRNISHEKVTQLCAREENLRLSLKVQELIFCVCKHLEKLRLKNKFQPFRLSNDKGEPLDFHESHLTFHRLFCERGWQVGKWSWWVGEWIWQVVEWSWQVRELGSGVGEWGSGIGESGSMGVCCQLHSSTRQTHSLTTRHANSTPLLPNPTPLLAKSTPRLPYSPCFCSKKDPKVSNWW